MFIRLHILDDLQRKARLVDPEGRWPAVSYVLFAKAGFTPALVARAAAEGVRLVGPEALVTGEDLQPARGTPDPTGR